MYINVEMVNQINNELSQAKEAIQRVREVHKHIVEHHEAHIHIDDAQWLESSPDDMRRLGGCESTYCFNCEKHYCCASGYQMGGAMYDPDAEFCDEYCEARHTCETPKWGCKGWHSEYCSGCYTADDTSYPCPTIKALQGTL